MQLQFVGKNIDVTPALKSFATEKMKLLEKRFPRITIVNVVFHIEHKTQIVEATIHVDGTEIHASAKEDDMYKAIDAIIDKLMGQMTKHKEKTIENYR
ncbi:MAG: ribosome-associated translation inhibitor RaiA [Gammaproteobacteria bacterium]|nr:ribosome-associated translation inhibitor RaiA [Gammaproteobacteria bacterium]MCW5582749.1 ribosome-associated translation inhibitor RaiA [Gammaproteobacteria bacterium]